MVSRDTVPDAHWRGFTFHFRPGVGLGEEQKLERITQVLGIDRALLESGNVVSKLNQLPRCGSVIMNGPRAEPGIGWISLGAGRQLLQRSGDRGLRDPLANGVRAVTRRGTVNGLSRTRARVAPVGSTRSSGLKVGKNRGRFAGRDEEIFAS